MSLSFLNTCNIQAKNDLHSLPSFYFRKHFSLSVSEARDEGSAGGWHPGSDRFSSRLPDTEEEPKTRSAASATRIRRKAPLICASSHQRQRAQSVRAREHQSSRSGRPVTNGNGYHFKCVVPPVCQRPPDCTSTPDRSDLSRFPIGSFWWKSNANIFCHALRRLKTFGVDLLENFHEWM